MDTESGKEIAGHKLINNKRYARIVMYGPQSSPPLWGRYRVR